MASSPESGAASSPGADSDTAARFRRAKSVENTPGTRTPMKETRTTPDKAEKPPDPVPATPANIDRSVANVLSEKDTSSAAGKSDPREVLKSIEWPSTINQWGQLQSKIWAGHQQLPQGWVRIW